MNEIGLRLIGIPSVNELFYTIYVYLVAEFSMDEFSSMVDIILVFDNFRYYSLMPDGL